MNLKVKQWIDAYIGKTLVALNLLIVRALGILLKRDHSLKKSPNHILVIKMLGIGSILMATDSIYSLKKKYPEARLILLCGKGIAPGVKPLNLFDEIWINEDSDFISMVRSGLSILVKAIRLKNLWVVDLEVYSVLTTLFSTWTCAINRFGFQLNKVHFRNYLNTHNVYFNQFITVNQNYEKLVMAMGVEIVERFDFNPPAIENPFGTRCIALNNTCSDLGDGVKKLPDDLFESIINYLSEHTNYTLLLTGAPRDFESNEAFIESRFKGKSARLINIAGKFSFADYYSLLKHHCAAMLTIDSAPFHIAVRLNLPSLSFWGPINPTQCLKFNEQKTHLEYYLAVPCSPCIHHTEILPCGGNNICMKKMQMKEIELRINQLLTNVS